MKNSTLGLADEQPEILDQLLEIGQTIQRQIIENPQQVYQLIVETICQVTGADCAVIYPYHPSFGEFYDVDNVAAYGLRHELPIEQRADKRKRLSARVHREDEIVYEDVGQEDPQAYNESSFIRREGVKAFMGLSLKVGDDILGILYVDYREPHHFPPEEKRIVHLFGQQAALAVSTSWSSRLADIRGEAVTKLKAVGKTLIAEDLSKTLDSVLDEIAQSAQEVLDADMVDLYQYVQTRNEFILPPVLVGQRWHPHVPKTQIYDDDVVMRAVKIGEPQYFDDAQKKSLLTGAFEVPRDDAPDQRFVIREGIVSSAMIPLIAVDEAVGVMFVNYRTPQLFDPEQKDVIESFATQAAIAIHNARLFQQEQHRSRVLSEFSNDFAVLHEVANDLARQPTLEQIYQTAVQAASDTLHCKHSTIFILDKKLGELVAMDRVGALEPAPEVKHFKLGEGLVGTVAETGEAILVNDTTKDRRFIEGKVMPRSFLRSIILAPIKIEDEVVGVISADKEEADGFTGHNLRVLEMLAIDIGVAINARRQLQVLTELNELAPQLVSIEEAPQETPLLEQIAGSAQAVLRADLIELYEYLPKQDEYRLPQISVGERRGPEVLKEKIHEDDSVFKLIQRDKPLYVENAQGGDILLGPYRVEREGRPTDRFVVREGIQSSAAIPLRTGTEVVGLMFANYRTSQTFTPQQREIIELFANQAAIAIHNSRLFNESLRQRNELQALNEVGETLTSGIRLKEDEILELIYEQTRKLTNAQDMYIALYDEETNEIRFPLMLKEGQREALEPREANMEKRGKTEEIIFTQEPILHKTEEEATKWYKQPGHQEFMGGDIWPSWLGVPMIVSEKVLGVIVVYSLDKEYAYDEHDLQVLLSMASQAAIALDNASLYYEVNQALERRIEALNVLTEVGKTLTSSIDLQENEILELIYEQTHKLTHARDMYIALYDDATGMISFPLAMEKGKRTEITKPRPADMTRRGKTEEIILTRQPILHRTRQEAEAWYQQSGHQEFTGHIQPSWIGVPMMLGEKVLGVIAIYDYEREYVYDEHDRQTLLSMASQAAIALDNANLLKERASISEELIATRQVAALGTATAALQHRINNTLNIIVPNISRLRRRVDQSDETIQEILDIIERNAQYTSDYIRRIQDPLKETKVQEMDVNLSLRDAQTQVEQQYRDRTGYGPVKVEYDLAEPLPSIKASLGRITEVFRNLVENSYKAMGADGGSLTIVSRRAGNWLEVEIQDTGPGIPEKIQNKLFSKPVPSRQPGEGAGLGLWLSAMLLQQYAGEIEVTNPGPDGTTVLVRLPVQRTS